MLTSFVQFAVRFRGIVIALACLLVGYGLYTLSIARRDVFPEFAPPAVVVQTESPGLTAEQVEALVSQPVENALGGIQRLAAMRSKSIQGLSVITLTFADSVDTYLARQWVTERLSALSSTLPQGVRAPTLLPLTSSTGVVRVAGIVSDHKSLMDLRTLADWTIKPQLLRLTGVSDVVVLGGDVKELQIQVDPRKLVQYGFSLQDVLNAAQRATGIRGAGFVEGANQRIALSTEGQLLDPAQLAQVVLRYQDGVAVHLGDVATVAVGPAMAIGAASFNGRPGVSLMIDSQYGADLQAVSQRVQQKLAELKPVLAAQQVVLLDDVFRPADFIDVALSHLRNALLLGGVLVIAVLFLFLMDVRTAVISATAIPLSLLAAVVVLHHLGVSLNTMTLGGLAIALGEVVDDAVVNVENIFRRLRENQALAQPASAMSVVLTASLEVRSAVIYATLIVALVFLPVLTLSGVAGRLFAPLASAYIISILASLLIALTVTPALAYLLLARHPLRHDEPLLIRRMKARYQALLSAVDIHARLVYWGLAVLCAGAIATLPLMEGNFIPELKEGHYIVHMALAPGASLAESMRVGTRLTQALKQIPGVRTVAQRAGRASDSVDATGVNVSEFEIDLGDISAGAQARALASIHQVLAGFPGVTASANTFLAERIDESISGVTAPVVINVFGDDLDLIDSKAQEIAKLVGGIRGATGVRIESAQRVPQMTLRLRPEQLTRWGFTPADVLDAIQAAYEGVTAAQVYEGTQVHDLTVSLAPAARRSPALIGALLLRSPGGTTVPLSELAEVVQTYGRDQIKHAGGQRLQTITASLGDRPAAEVIAEAQRLMAKNVSLPKGMYVLFEGEEQARKQSAHELMVYTALAAVGIAILLYSALGSGRSLILVAANLPFALVGGVLMVWAGGGSLSLGSLVGFVTLVGITLRNSIMLVSHYQQLVEDDWLPWTSETAQRGASERLLPIMMTAVVTGLGLLPLALSSGTAGNEVEGPMALVILGGLVTSTVLNLLILPTLALRFGRFESRPDLSVSKIQEHVYD